MRSRIATAALLMVLCVGLGCATGGGNQFQNTVYDTHRRVVNLDKNLDGSINKLNQTAAELVARTDASDQQIKSLQSVMEENQVKLAQLEQKLDRLVSKLYGDAGRSVAPSRGNEVGVNVQEPVIVTPRGGASAPMTSAPTSAPLPAPSSAPVPSPEPQALESVGAVTPAAPAAEAAEPAAPAATPAAPAAVASSGSSEADYQKAQKSYANGDYAGALEQFGGFLQQYGDSENASNAAFWKAKSLQSLERYDEAVKDFDTLRSKYPTSPKVPYAMHQQAVCYARLGQTAKAIQLLQDVAKDYPMTPAADQAKTDLKRLQGN